MIIINVKRNRRTTDTTYDDMQIHGGHKEKIRPGEVLCALTGEAGLTREQVGKIKDKTVKVRTLEG